MIISVNWLKKFTNIDISIGELASLIGSRLVEIEEVIDLNKKYKDVVVAKVVEAGHIEGSDHLSLTKLDDGGTVSGVERDEDGLIQVVCGAPNVLAGQMVAWLPPKTIVPSTFEKTEPFVLGSRKLQGYMSQGMIASAEELDLFEDHTGILVLDDDLKPGASFAEVYELNDYLLDIENKSLTHRPDCFGVIGFAREVAAISGQPFTTPDWLMDINPDFANCNDKELTVKIDNPEISSRYQAIVVSNADSNRQSPLLIQTYLARMGVRPINAVVDVTNYLMILTGQPLHAFDYDKVVEVSGGKPEIHVRGGRRGETLKLLDGKTIELDSEDIVIAAGDKAIALAGAMGGANSEIDACTKNIIIESATFNLYNLRSTQMRHGIYSEAITRFTKGLTPSLTAPVLQSAAQLMGEWAGATPVSGVVEDYPVKQAEVTLEVNADDVNQKLGTKYSKSKIADTLYNVEFKVNEQDEKLIVTSPYWRADIHIPEDIVEEVGRINGFDSIEPSLPLRPFTAVGPSDLDKFRQTIRQVLVRAGLNEVLSYSFVHGDVLKKVGQDPKDSYKIVNSISPSLQYYRQSLTPSLLEMIHPNVKQGYDSFGIFEINKTHARSLGMDEDGVPVEMDKLAVVVTSRHPLPGAAYYYAKRFLDYIVTSLGIGVDYQAQENKKPGAVFQPFEYRHAAEVSDLGIIGEYKKSVCKSFKLPEFTAGFELDLRQLFELYQNRDITYTSLSRYPSSDRDISFRVDGSVNYQQVIDAVRTAVNSLNLEISVALIDIYRPEDSDSKNITIRIRFTSHDHTLTSDELNQFTQTIADSVTQATNATVI